MALRPGLKRAGDGDVWVTGDVGVMHGGDGLLQMASGIWPASRKPDRALSQTDVGEIQGKKAAKGIPCDRGPGRYQLGLQHENRRVPRGRAPGKNMEQKDAYFT